MNLTNINLAVFESSIRQNYYPFSLTRPCFDLVLGTQTLLKRIEGAFSSKANYLFVPNYLEELTKENHQTLKVNLENVEGRTLFVNSLLIAESPEIVKLIEWSLLQDDELVCIGSEGSPIFGILKEGSQKLISREFLGSRVRRIKLPAGLETTAVLYRYPWDLIEQNSGAIKRDYNKKLKSKVVPENSQEILGNKLSLSPSASVSRFVVLDSRNGPVIIDDEAQVDSFSHLIGPCFIGKGSLIKGAKIREGTSIMDSCRIAGEVEESIFLDHTNKNHEGFVGHSIIGSWVNLGALTTNSDLKNTYGEIRVRLGSKLVNTGSIKVGVFVGDMSKTGIGAMLSSGKSVGVSSQVLGALNENVPSFTIHGSGKKNDVEMYLDSAIETQAKMMSRRNASMSEAYVSMMKSVFKLTRNDRIAMKVSKGKFRLSA